MADICALVYPKGYTIAGQFYIKELTFVSPKITVSMLCGNPIDRNEITFEESKSENNIYQKTEPPLDSDKDCSQKCETEENSKRVYNVEHAIISMYELVRTDDKPKIGYKRPPANYNNCWTGHSPHMATILEKLGIPAVELSQNEFTMSLFDIYFQSLELDSQQE